jgi:splicing factor 3B subunit 4
MQLLSSLFFLLRNPQIARDAGTGISKSYGFVSYTDFDASDAAIESMNGQYLMNKAITVQYAFKKDGKGERHGTSAERLLAAQARKNNALPVAARPPPAPMTFGARPPPGFQGPYQGQFAGALAAAPPPPPPGFTSQQTIMPQIPMSIAPGMPPAMAMPPPSGVPVFGGFPPPPPPGFGGLFPPGGAPQPAPPPQF